jgi:hypothetical protein
MVHSSILLVSVMTKRKYYPYFAKVKTVCLKAKCDGKIFVSIGGLFQYQDNFLRMTGKDRMEKKYFVIVAAMIIAIGIFGALTAQLLVAAALIVMAAGCTIILNRYREGTSIPAEDPEGGEAILACGYRNDRRRAGFAMAALGGGHCSAAPDPAVIIKD